MHDTIKFWTERAEQHEAAATKFADLHKASGLNAHKIVADYHAAEAKTCREYVRVDTATHMTEIQPWSMGRAMASFGRIFGGTV